MSAAPYMEDPQLRRGTKSGAWIAVLLSVVNGEELGYQEWRDDLFLQYGIYPPDFPPHCDGCNVALSIYHTLDLNKGVLITTCHNDLRDGFVNLAGESFTPSHMRDNPLIHTGHAVLEGKAQTKGLPPKNPTASR